MEPTWIVTYTDRRTGHAGYIELTGRIPADLARKLRRIMPGALIRDLYPVT